MKNWLKALFAAPVVKRPKIHRIEMNGYEGWLWCANPLQIAGFSTRRWQFNEGDTAELVGKDGSLQHFEITED